MRLATHLLSRALLAVALASLVSPAATLSRYPYLQNVGADHATILWATLESGNGAARYSTDQKTFRTVQASIRPFLPSQTSLVFTYYQYQADLSGLQPSTDYYYQVQLDGADLLGELVHFRTAGPGPFNFLAFGDSGAGTPEQLKLAGMMMREPGISLVVHTGDIAYMHGSFQEFQSNHFDIYDNASPALNGNLMRSIPFFMCPGNHEYYNGSLFPYLSLHAPPKQGVPAEDAGHYYSFDWANAHFISLDTNVTEGAEPGDEWRITSITPFYTAMNGIGGMLKWLDQDLAGTNKFWRILFYHEAPYAGGNNVNDPAGADVRKYIAPILERYDVPLEMNGHEHSYQRSLPIRNNAPVAPDSGGTVYITTGGGGQFIYPTTPPPAVGPVIAYAEGYPTGFHYVRVEVQPYQITLRAIRIDGKEIDRVTLAPKPRADAAVNGASFAPQLAPGALISVFGRHLAADEASAPSLPLPTQFPGISMALNGRPLPLLYVSATQINAQLPFDVKGAATLRVTTPNGFSDITVTIADVAPAISTAYTDQGPIPAVLHANSSTLVTPSAPAKAGEYVSIYLTGLGQVDDGTIAAGQAAPASPPALAIATVQVQLDNGPLLVPSFAGLAPGFAGLYQVNVRIPPETNGSTHQLRIIAAGNSSNAVSLVVASSAQ